ncbi:MAG TPA: thiamine pyrophosphate-binding protein [Thermomicrobiales bacterium]|nr:thiamine pyrophosphate-binding protein [Thermomicrobiales bacterium]
MERMTGWQAIVRGLEAENVGPIFGLPGSPGQFYDQLYDSKKLRSVLVRHETSGAFMAMAWARVTNQPAVAFGSPGPGVANLVPGVLEAYSGCTPMIVLGVRASTKLEGMGAFQETDQLGMFRPITKWAATIERTDRAQWYLRRAVSIATSGQPGPVYLEFPADLGTTEAEFPAYQPAPRPVRPAPDPDAIARAADLIAASHRPLIVCGGGAVLSGAGEALAAFIDRHGIPFQTTPAGRGVIGESHPMACGMVGLYRTTFPRELYEESDLLITIGSRMEEFQSGAFRFFPEGARFIQIDIEPFELGRNWVPDVAIQSDARLAVEALDAALVDRGYVADAARVVSIQERRAAAIEDAIADARENSMPMRGRSVVRAINDAFGPNTILVKENGGADLWSYFWPYYQSFDANSVVPPAEQTAMGLGVAGAIAAKMARPECQVVCTTGDGAFQMAMHELPTAVQENAPVTWVVFNDAALGWPRWGQTHSHNGRYIATQFDPAIDVVAVAHASGCRGWRVNDPAELVTYLEMARRSNAEGYPAVVDVPIDQEDKHVEFFNFHNVRHARV